VRCVAALILAAVGSLPACKKSDSPDSAAAAPAPGRTDELWHLAPPDLRLGVVAADGALAMVHDGWAALSAGLAQLPGAAELVARVRQAATLSGVPLTDRAALAAAGIDLARGAAVFVREGGGMVLVLPVVDREAFVERLGGSPGAGGGADTLLGALSCRDAAGRYVCVAGPASTDGARAPADLARWPAAQRGHVELWMAPSALEGVLEQAIAGGTGLRVALALERGGATVRAHWTGTPRGPAAAFAGRPRGPLVAELAGRADLSGFLALDAGGFAGLAALAGSVPPGITVGPVALRDLVGSMRGDVVIWGERGLPASGGAAIGLGDEAPARALVEACTLPPVVPGFALAREGERCILSVPNQPMGGTLRAEIRVDKGALRLGVAEPGAAGANPGPALPAIGKEILDHQVALWGHGFMVDAADVGTLPVPRPDLLLYAATHLSGLGIGARIAPDGIHGLLHLRTVWANPPELVAVLEPLLVAFARGDAGVAASIRALAARHPSSPFAGDLAAGHAGLMPLAGGVGVLAAIAIPAYVKYVKKSKAAEARHMVRRIADGGRAFFAATPHPQKPRFPAPSAGPTPPLGTCCVQGEKCTPDPALWAVEPWTSLRFSVDDPHYFSYSYRRAQDGASFTALAHGDLDCDGVYSTFAIVEVLGAPAAADVGVLRVMNDLE
jgi:type IV pilus assembly protein PilA